MSAQETETAGAATVTANGSKKLTILVAAALFFSVLAVILLVLLLLRPVTSKIQEGTTEIKEAIEGGNTALGKKMEALRDACVDWQAVLKAASDKPDAVFRIEKSADGLLLSLVEVKAGEAHSADAAEAKK